MISQRKRKKQIKKTERKWTRRKKRKNEKKREKNVDSFVIKTNEANRKLDVLNENRKFSVSKKMKLQKYDIPIILMTFGIHTTKIFFEILNILETTQLIKRKTTNFYLKGTLKVGAVLKKHLYLLKPLKLMIVVY